MRMIFGFVLVIGLGLAGFAVYMARNYVQGYQAQLAAERNNRDPGIDTVDIYVAAEALKYGQTLTPDKVRLTPFPKASLPKGVFKSKDALFPDGENLPRRALRSIEKNEAILAVKVTEPGQEAGITSQLEPGMRAFAINVDASSGVSGFLRPGDRVDIYWTGKLGDGLQLEGGSSGDITRLIEDNIKLVAVGQVTDPETTETINASTVTASVTPQQVAALKQAQSTGRLSLSLVGADDTSIAQVIEVDQRRLLGLKDPVVEKAPEKKKTCSIRTRRGAEVIETPIPCTN